MSEILIVKDTVEVNREVKTVEVPDYQPRLDALEELKQVKAKANVESNRAVVMLGDSILEQIATYLQEMVKPILEYYEQQNADISSDIRWFANGWAFEPRKECGQNRLNMLQLRNDKNAHYFWIRFTTDGYQIFDSEVSMEQIRDLASRWPEFKQYTNQRITAILNNIQYEEERKIRYHQDVINALKNFEL